MRDRITRTEGSEGRPAGAVLEGARRCSAGRSVRGARPVRCRGLGAAAAAVGAPSGWSPGAGEGGRRLSGGGGGGRDSPCRVSLTSCGRDTRAWYHGSTGCLLTTAWSVESEGGGRTHPGLG